MIVTTMDGIAGRITQETMGLVRGTHLWTRRVIKTSFGGIRNFEVTGVQQMDQGLNDAKEQANKAMIDQAKALGGDAVIGVRIDVVEMSNGVFCVNATGTAVKTIPLPITVPFFRGSAGGRGRHGLRHELPGARPSFEGSTLRH